MWVFFYTFAESKLLRAKMLFELKVNISINFNKYFLVSTIILIFAYTN